MMFAKLKSKKAMTTGRQGYSLVEILAAMVIISTVMIISTSSIFSSAQIALNNEIADRANTMAVRILELTRTPSEQVNSCRTGAALKFEVGKTYIIPSIDLSNANQATNVCMDEIVDNALITTCTEDSQYATDVILPSEDRIGRKEVFCLQMKIGDIQDSTLDKITVRMVYDDLSTQDVQRTFYGLI